MAIHDYSYTHTEQETADVCIFTR